MSYDDYQVPESTRCSYCNGDGQCYAHIADNGDVIDTYADDEIKLYAQLPIEAQGLCECPYCEGHGYFINV